MRAKIDRALEAVRTDQRASPVLVAVVGEFAAKGEKAAAPTTIAVIDLEYAGDSAEVAEADTGVPDTTRKAVLDAHLAICAKSNL